MSGPSHPPRTSPAGSGDGRPFEGPPPAPVDAAAPRLGAADPPVQVLLARIFAVPGTLLAVALVGCLFLVPIAIIDPDTSVANWVPVPAYGLASAIVVGVARLSGLRRWVPTELPVWSMALVTLPGLGDELNLRGGPAVALAAVGVALSAALVARLVVFHVWGYRTTGTR